MTHKQNKTSKRTIRSEHTIVDKGVTLPKQNIIGERTITDEQAIQID